MATLQLERQWLILRTLTVRRHGATVKELAEEHGTSLKTIRRDLDALKKLGFPVHEKAGEFGRNHWFCDPQQKFAHLGFNISEVLSLYLARRLLEPLAGTYLWESTRTAFAKIRATLTEEQQSYLAGLARVLHPVHSRTSNYDGKEEMIDDLVVAVEDRRIVRFTYQSANSTEPLTYFIHPLGVIHYQQSLYLIAYSQHHEEIRHFKIDRVTDVVLQELRFRKPIDFEMQKYLQHAFRIFHEGGEPQRVVIRFAADVRAYVEEHRWHPSQEFSVSADGRLVATFELASFSELKSWILSFGTKAEIVDPPEWRDELIAEVRQMLDLYESEESWRG